MACPLQSVSPATSALRSSLIRPCLVRRYQLVNYGNSRSSATGRCVAQIAVPKLAEALQSGLGPEMQESIIRLYHDVLHNAVELGAPFSADETAVAHWAIAVPAALLYTLATPGPLAGLTDFVQGHIHANSFPTFSADDVEIGRQMGEGSFGIVHEGFIGKGKKKQDKRALHVVLKKMKAKVMGAHEMRDAEIHMNQRLQRTAPGACAEFLGTVNVTVSQARGKLTEGVWLVWQYQGDRTLDYYLKQKNFPENIAEAVLGKRVKKGALEEVLNTQRALVVRKVMQQILLNLRDLHRSGVVHRDLKPLNLVLTEDSGWFKLIDLGACVDIRSGYNYTPDETVIDPTYAAPEHYVMPTCTPALPPDPLCSVVSPLVWVLNTPDRFDLYSAGLILMQLSIKQLRQDVGLQNFNSHLKRAGYDLDVWRKRCNISNEEFAILDADGGAGWELAKAMLQARHDKSFFIWPSLGSSRPSAAAALNHRFIQGTLFPQSIDFSKLAPDFSSFPKPASLGQLRVPVFSASAVRSAVGQFSNIQETVSDIDSGRVGTAISAAIPTAATSALAFATGWTILTALKSSAEMTYDMGQWMAESMGISGSTFLAFFLFIKPWLEDQEIASRREREMQSSVESDQLALASLGSGVPSTDALVQEILATKQRQPGTLRLKTGLSEAVSAMEAQLASLEFSISQEQEFAVQQQELLTRMESLLTPPPAQVVYAASSDMIQVPKSSNGAYLKPFSEYIS